jgi:hypothetical protein
MCLRNAKAVVHLFLGKPAPTTRSLLISKWLSFLLFTSPNTKLMGVPAVPVAH